MSHHPHAGTGGIELDRNAKSGPPFSYWVGFAVIAAIAGTSIVFNVLFLAMWSHQEDVARLELPKIQEERDRLTGELSRAEQHIEEQKNRIKSLGDIKSELNKSEAQLRRRDDQLARATTKPGNLPLINEQDFLKRLTGFNLQIRLDKHASEAGVRVGMIKSELVDRYPEFKFDDNAPFLLEVSVDRLAVRTIYAANAEPPNEAIMATVKIYERVRVPGTDKSYWTVIRDYALQASSTESTTSTVAIDTVVSLMNALRSDFQPKS